jgi:hypothetical protein
MTRWTIMKTEYTDAGPVESLHSVFTGPEEHCRVVVARLNEMKFRRPKHPTLRDATGELFHPPTKFEAVPHV